MTEPKWSRIHTYPASQQAEAERRAELLNIQAQAFRPGVTLAEWRVHPTPQGAGLESRPMPYNLPFKRFCTGFREGFRAVCLHCGATQTRPYTGTRGIPGALESGVRWADKHRPWCPGPLEPRYTSEPQPLGAEFSGRLTARLSEARSKA